MELTSVLERAARVDLAGADRAGVTAMFADLARLTSWIEARRIAGIRRLDQVPDARFAETVVTEATREPARDAQRTVERAATVDVFVRFAKALEAGEINAAHVDALTHARADVPEAKHDALIAQQDRLLDAARRQTSEAFAKSVRKVVKELLSSEEATARLQRQQRATRLTCWKNKATQMVHLRGCFDPETGAQLMSHLESCRQQLYPDPMALPATTPVDPVERDDHLRALTLAKLLLDGDIPGARPETLMVVDEQTHDEGFHDNSIVDIGIDADVPHEAIQRLAARCKIVRVTMRNGIVTSVGGRSNLNLGRTSRLADADQRRALRAMYPTCAIPDCPIRFHHCKIHHANWWEHGGSTDLANLIPLCSRHHHAVHDWGWTLTLDPSTRHLTVTHPDGRATTRPPPYAHSA